MRFGSFFRRIAKMQPEGCPYCLAWAAIPEEERDEKLGACLDALVEGKRPTSLWKLPDPSLSCPRCGQAAAMDNEELDVKLSRLIDRARERRVAAGP